MTRLSLSHLRNSPRRHQTVVFWFTVAVAALIAGLLSFLIGVQQSIWFDEAHSILLAHQPIDRLIHLAAVDVHPPIYFLVLKAWATFFSWGDVSLRILGAVMAAALVGAVALLAKTIFGRRAGVLAAVFVALSPFIIRYDFELRMYSLAAIIVVLATYVLVKAVGTTYEKQRYWLWLAYAVLVALGMYTLYYTVFIWIGHALWLLSSTLRARRRVISRPAHELRFGLIAYGFAMVLWLPWLFVFIKQLTNGALANITQPLTAINTLSFVSFSFFYQPFGRLSMVQSLLFWVVVIVIVGLVAYSLRVKQRSPYFSLVAAAVITPFVILSFLSLVKPLYVERYLVPVVPLFFVLLAGLCAYAYKVKPVHTNCATVVLIACCVVGFTQLAQVGNFNFQRNESIVTRQAVSYIESQCQPGAIIFSNDPYIYIQSLPYLQSDCPFFFYEPSDTLSGGYAGVSRSSQQIKSADSIGNPAKIIYAYYDKPAVSIPPIFTQTTKRSYGNLFIVTYVSEARAAE
ncbi:MAG: glycosyltransferase family 39 protein [Candidatus Microsaccharimonas sp.]